jgi:hypothetical protein
LLRADGGIDARRIDDDGVFARSRCERGENGTDAEEMDDTASEDGAERRHDAPSSFVFVTNGWPKSHGRASR